MLVNPKMSGNPSGPRDDAHQEVAGADRGWHHHTPLWQGMAK